MQIVKIKLPKLHPAQLQVKQTRKRFNVLCNGRRWGKNILLQDFAVEAAVVHRQPCAWATPSYKMLSDDWQTLTNILAPVIEKRSEQEKQVRFVGGGVLDMWSLDNADSVRGRKYARFMVNEAAFVPNLMAIWNMVIRPTLIDLQGDAYFSGTPKGRNGFWQLYQQQGEDWARWQMSSYSNPHIPASELDALRETMTERAFQQEIMAQFLEDGGGVFRFVNDAAVLQDTPAEKGTQYIIGADWARTEDATVFAVVRVDTRECVHLDRMVNTDFASQRIRLKALSESYNRALVIAEQNSIGSPQIEELQNMGVSIQGFLTTNATKSEVIRALELAFEQRSIRIVNDETLKNELLAYESERLPSGLVRYSAPEGMHDDCVIALALAWHGIVGGGRIETMDNPLDF
jgi:hypothetical protein